MNILETLQSITPQPLSSKLNIHAIVHTQQERAKARYIKARVMDNSHPYTRDYFTEEEYAVICEKMAEQLEFANYKNNQLLYETLGLSGGDDYDGCFTFIGQIQYDCLHSELERRLIECGFLSEQGIYDFGSRDDFGL